MSSKNKGTTDFHISQQRKEVWKIELDLLNELQRVCKKHHLRVFAEAGTFLGAIRHKGFIPWDDDIDVAMFREDYDKLLEIAPQEFNYPFFLQNTYSDSKYVLGHAQLRHSGTTAILKKDITKNLPYNQGIFLDIFALDAVPKDMRVYKKIGRKINLYNKMLFDYAYTTYAERSIKGKISLFLIRTFFSVFPYQRLYRHKEDLLRSIATMHTADIVAPLNFKYEIEKRGRDKHLYDKTIMVPFENTSVCVPADYDTYLKKRYGEDYMTPQQISTTHGDVIFDTKQSYKDFIKNYSKGQTK